MAEPVISIATGGRVRTGNAVTVQDRAQTLVVRVSADGARVEGFARSGDKGVAGAMVLLVPNDPAAFPDRGRGDPPFGARPGPDAVSMTQMAERVRRPGVEKTGVERIVYEGTEKQSRRSLLGSVPKRQD